MNISITLSNEQISDTLCSALEGGSNYWYSIVAYIEPSAWTWDSEPKCSRGHYANDYPLNPGGGLVISDEDDDSTEPDAKRRLYRLDEEAIQRGMGILAEKHPAHYADILTGDADAITGDVFLQCCLFGEIIYG